MPKPKILIMKGKKQYFEDLDREITIVKEKRFYIEDTSKDFSTPYGMIKKTDLKKKGTVMSSNKKKFCIFDSDFADDYRRIRRLPQIIPLKDIGFIIAATGIGPQSVVVEGGSGSGALGIMLARFCKKVYSYEIEPKHHDVAKENAKKLGLKNMTFKKKSMYDKIDEKGVDLVCFDLPAPWEALNSADKALKQGGFIVSYSPTIVQATDFVNNMEKIENLIHIKTVEIIERPWEIDGRKVRPRSKSIIHSGFLTLARKIS